MGLLDGLIGGVVGAEMASVVNTFIQQHGGVQGIVSQLESQGLGGHGALLGIDRGESGNLAR